MSATPQRYSLIFSEDIGNYIDERREGEFVLFSDWEALKAERDELVERESQRQYLANITPPEWVDDLEQFFTDILKRSGTPEMMQSRLETVKFLRQLYQTFPRP